MADVSVFRNEADVAKAVSEFVIGVANQSISDRGVFTIGLSGIIAHNFNDVLLRTLTL